MKSTVSLAVSALLTLSLAAHAGITVLGPSYGLSDYYTHTNTDSIASFDWDSTGKLYYETATPSFNFGGFYSYNGASTATLANGSSDFSGSSVAALGNFERRNGWIPTVNCQASFSRVCIFVRTEKRWWHGATDM